MLFGNNIWFEQHRLLYIAIPKAANSAIKHALLPLIGMEGKRFANIHDRDKVGFQYVESKQVRKLRSRCFTFGVVRNPWDRIVSTYNDKICREPIHKPFLRYGFTPQTTFPEFVRTICEAPDHDADVHVRSQWSMLVSPDGCLMPHMVLQMERLMEDWPAVAGIIEAMSGIAPSKLEIINTKPHDHYHQFYDDETRELVRGRYKREIDLFGYEY